MNEKFVLVSWRGDCYLRNGKEIRATRVLNMKKSYDFEFRVFNAENNERTCFSTQAVEERKKYPLVEILYNSNHNILLLAD